MSACSFSSSPLEKKPKYIFSVKINPSTPACHMSRISESVFRFLARATDGRAPFASASSEGGVPENRTMPTGFCLPRVSSSRFSQKRISQTRVRTTTVRVSKRDTDATRRCDAPRGSARFAKGRSLIINHKDDYVKIRRLISSRNIVRLFPPFSNPRLTRPHESERFSRLSSRRLTRRRKQFKRLILMGGGGRASGCLN